MNILASRLLVSGAAVVTVAGLALGGAAVANAAGSESTHAVSTTGVPFRAISAHAIRSQFGTLPSALKTDLKALKDKKGDDRKAAIATIEQKALSGGYGDQVKSVASEAKAAWADAPAALKEALRTTRKASDGDRAKDYAAIESKALSGGYGDAVQTYANTVQTNVQKQQQNKLASIVGRTL